MDREAAIIAQKKEELAAGDTGALKILEACEAGFLVMKQVKMRNTGLWGLVLETASFNFVGTAKGDGKDYFAPFPNCSPEGLKALTERFKALPQSEGYYSLYL